MRMVRQAKGAVITLRCSNGMLKALAIQVVEASLDELFNEHLGYDLHDSVGCGGDNFRNATMSNMAVIGIEIQVSCERNGTFEPRVVKKRQCVLPDMEAMG